MGYQQWLASSSPDQGIVPRRPDQLVSIIPSKSIRLEVPILFYLSGSIRLSRRIVILVGAVIVLDCFSSDKGI
jgi:hypothetical protein